MKKVIILNGPSQSGKDTYGRILCSLFDAKHCQFKDALFDETEKYFNAHSGFIKQEYDTKDTFPWKRLGGRTIRQALIYVSERVLKPKYGKDCLGKIAADNLEEGINVFTDGGFEEELDAIIEKVGIHNIVILRLHRDGYTFDGDSRSYLEDRAGLDINDVGNDGIDSKPSVMEEILGVLNGRLF